MTSTELTVYPQPDILVLSEDRYSRSELQITPYKDLEWQKAVYMFGVKVPFEKIVMKTDGVSICSHCGARYAGLQGRCQRIVRKCYIKNTDSYYEESTPAISEAYVVGQILRSYKNYQDKNVDRYVSRIVDGLCDGYGANWSLQCQWDAQCQFFQSLNTMLSYHQHANSINGIEVGNSDEAQKMLIQYLFMENSGLRAQISNLEFAVNYIKDRLNAAGHQLTF